jgi:hypothetical protein
MAFAARLKPRHFKTTAFSASPKARFLVAIKAQAKAWTYPRSKNSGNGKSNPPGLVMGAWRVTHPTINVRFAYVDHGAPC